jgi:dienelactone hydrolase
VRHLGDVSHAELQRLLPETTVDNGYSLFTIALWSGGEETRATVAIPLEGAGALHVVAACHGTTGLGAPCALVGTSAGAALAGLFGARGALGVAPEYAGLSSGRPSPYLVAESESRVVLDAVRAARALARWRGVPLSGRVALTGLSQGGHAALAAAARARTYAPELDLRAVAVAGPSSAWEEHWRTGVQRDGEHLVYHAMLVFAWASHYGFAGPPLWADRVARTIADDLRTRCAWAPEGAPLLRLPKRARELFSPGFLHAYRSGWWGPYAPFRTWFGWNRLGAWRGAPPVKIYQGSADAAVPEAATRQLAFALKAGGVPVEYEVVRGAGHLDTALGFLGAPEKRGAEAAAWVLARLTA